MLKQNQSQSHYIGVFLFIFLTAVACFFLFQWVFVTNNINTVKSAEYEISDNIASNDFDPSVTTDFPQNNSSSSLTERSY